MAIIGPMAMLTSIVAIIEILQIKISIIECKEDETDYNSTEVLWKAERSQSGAMDEKRK